MLNRNHAAGRIQNEVARAVQAVRSRLKDMDAIRAVELDLTASREYLEHAARMAMAALLLVLPLPAPSWVCAVGTTVRAPLLVGR